MTFSWIEFVFGLWLILSPWLLGFSDMAVMKWSNVVIGLVVTVINAWVLFGKKVDSISKI